MDYEEEWEICPKTKIVQQLLAQSGSKTTAK